MNKTIALILIFCCILQVAALAEKPATAKPREDENVKIRNGIIVGAAIGFLSAAVFHAFGVPFLSSQDIVNHLVLGGAGAVAGYYISKANIEKEKSVEGEKGGE